MKFVQSCDSRECYKIEKERVGVKNIDIITRIHEYNDKTNEIKCLTCGKISYANETKKLKEEKKRSAKVEEIRLKEIEAEEAKENPPKKLPAQSKVKIKESKNLRTRIEAGIASNVKSNLKRKITLFKSPI
jgi:hypothetical protein